LAGLMRGGEAPLLSPPQESNLSLAEREDS
jgi:hypothetical protein